MTAKTKTEKHTLHCPKNDAHVFDVVPGKNFHKDTCYASGCNGKLVSSTLLGEFAKDIPKTKKGATVKFECSLHGEQEFDHFGFASITLKCGCVWRAKAGGGGVIPVEFVGYWQDGDVSTQPVWKEVPASRQR